MNKDAFFNVIKLVFIFIITQITDFPAKIQILIGVATVHKQKIVMALLVRNLSLFNGNTRRFIASLQQAQRHKATTPINLGVMFVPQQVSFIIMILFTWKCLFFSTCNYNTISKSFQEAWVVERMGKFSRILNPGLNFLIPFIDEIKYVQSLKVITMQSS